MSVQIDKLSAAGYIEATKDSTKAKPRTVCRMTEKGREAMRVYVDSLKTYFEGL